MVDTIFKCKTMTYKLKVHKDTYDDIPPWIIISTINDMFKKLGIQIKIEEEIINTDEMEITVIEKGDE